MNESVVMHIDVAEPEAKTTGPVPAHHASGQHHDLGDRACCAVLGAVSLATLAWMLWAATYWMSALR